MQGMSTNVRRSEESSERVLGGFSLKRPHPLPSTLPTARKTIMGQEWQDVFYTCPGRGMAPSRM
jgi:hypothetical protein